MPPRVLRCRTCGAPLNDEVQPRLIEPPPQVQLPELSKSAALLLPPSAPAAPSPAPPPPLSGPLPSPAAIQAPQPAPQTPPSTAVATARGHFIGCPNCEQELRIAARFLGHRVQCKFCTAPFEFQRRNLAIRWLAMFVDCPHCGQELRVAMKYAGTRAACKFCDGALRIEDPEE